MDRMGTVSPIGWSFTLEAPERNRAWYETRGYEPYSIGLFAAACRRSSVVVDVGAHVGFYSLVAGEANPAAHVIAVEASPANTEVLRRNVGRSRSRRVDVVNAALGERSGTVEIHLTEASDNNGMSDHPNSPTIEVVDVRAMRGDELGIEEGARLTIKIDVEGHELAVLCGLESVIDAAAAYWLFVEFNPRCIDLAGGIPEQLLDWIFDRGMRVFVLDDERLSWRELHSAAAWRDVVDPTDYANLYCAPAEAITTVSSVMHSADVGGAERAQVEASRDLVERGHLVNAVVPEPDAGSGALWRAAGASVTVVPALQWWMLPPDEVHGEPLRWVERFVDSAVVDALRDVGPDVVVTASGVVPQGAVAAAALGIPHVWYFRELGDLDHGLVLPMPVRRFGPTVLSLTDVAIANSALIRDHLFVDPVDASRVKVIPSAPSPQRIVVHRSPDAPFTVMVVASYNPGKGHRDALEAIAHLRSHGLDVRLVLAGGGDPRDAERIVEASRELGITDLVSMPGVVGDPSELYSLADAVLVTSRSEAFGRVAFEATEAGLPVVYAAAGGIVEYMVPSVTGLAYDPGDSRALAEAIRALAVQPGLRDGLVEGARADLLDPVRRAAQFDAMESAVLEARARGPLPVDRQVLADLAAAAAARSDGSRRLVVALAALEHDLASLGVRNRALGEAHAELAAEYDALYRGNEGLAGVHEQLRAQHDDLFRGHTGLAAAYDSLAVEHERSSAAAQSRAEMLRMLHTAEEERERIVSSRSWRLADPVRAIRERLRRR